MPERHEVAVLALPDVVAFELGLPHKLIGTAVDDAERLLYRVRVATLDGGPVRTSAGYSVLPEHDASILRTADTVIVPGIYSGSATERGVLEPELAAALHGVSARMVSICTGAFVLAEAGLLDGRRAATHWRDAPTLAARHPAVEVDSDVLWVDDGRVLTSAGVAAGIDLCLHLVRKDLGTEHANRIARRMVVAPHRAGGQAQFVDQPVASPAGDALAATCAWMLEHLAEPLTVAAMARHAARSERSFARHFLAATGTTPQRWLHAQRVLHARRLLEETDLPVEVVAQEAGFGTATSLRTHFARATRTTPAAYRRAFTLRSGSAPPRRRPPTGSRGRPRGSAPAAPRASSATR
jgi:transcriptional regulator GlxA family with amidase domain